MVTTLNLKVSDSLTKSGVRCNYFHIHYLSSASLRLQALICENTKILMSESVFYIAGIHKTAHFQGAHV